MKIVTFWGGLGNQIFEYAYYKWLQKKYPNEKIYGFYPTSGLKNHNGLEVHKRFEIELPLTSFVSNILGTLLFNLNRICRKFHLPLVSTCTQDNDCYHRVFHCDYWQDKRYLISNLEMKFKLPRDIGEKNQKLLDVILSQETVAIHIRRGDYLNPNVASLYGGICTESYYHKALNEVLKNAPNSKLIFFSDDCQYVRETFNFENMVIVDWNKGEKSIYDMYLMSCCSHMILANSTFSYWAARLNKKVKQVYCPTRWTNVNSPDIILDTWFQVQS